MLPEDRPRFDELVYRRGEEPADHHIKVSSFIFITILFRYKINLVK